MASGFWQGVLAPSARWGAGNPRRENNIGERRGERREVGGKAPAAGLEFTKGTPFLWETGENARQSLHPGRTKFWEES